MTNHPKRKKTPLDKRTTNSRGYQVSQVFRRKVEGIIALVDAMQESVHRDPGRGRIAKTLRNKKRGDL